MAPAEQGSCLLVWTLSHSLSCLRSIAVSCSRPHRPSTPNGAQDLALCGLRWPAVLEAGRWKLELKPLNRSRTSLV